MIDAMRRAEGEKKDQWRAEAATYAKRFQEMALIVDKEDTAKELQKSLEDRVRSKLPITPEMVYVLHYLLYSAKTFNGQLYLAHQILHVSAAERLKMHNWQIYEMTPDLYKEDIGRAIASGKLMYPLFPCESLFDWNRVLANEVLQEIHGGSPGSNGEKTLYGRQLFGSPKAVEPLIGGGPQTSVPIYADGNTQPVGHADTTQIKDGMSKLYGMIIQVGQQNNTLRAQAQLQQKRIKALEEQLQSLNAHSGTNNRNFATRGREAREGRAGGRGTFGRGRGNSYSSGYYRGGEPEEDQYDDTYDTPKNA